MGITVAAIDRDMRHIDFYLLRGRDYKGLADDELNRLWTATFKMMFRSQSAADIVAHFDFRAELDLRGMDVPVETIGAELEMLRKGKRSPHMDVVNAGDCAGPAVLAPAPVPHLRLPP